VRAPPCNSMGGGVVRPASDCIWGMAVRVYNSVGRLGLQLGRAASGCPRRRCRGRRVDSATWRAEGDHAASAPRWPLEEPPRAPLARAPAAVYGRSSALRHQHCHCTGRHTIFSLPRRRRPSSPASLHRGHELAPHPSIPASAT
jgi:hypothetical protein